MGWVMNELASAELIADSPLAARYADELPQPFHVALLWHGPTMATSAASTW